MKQGVSSTFIRDIIHFHYSAFEDVWKQVNLLSADQFVEKSEFLEASIFDVISDQVSEEKEWLTQMADPITLADHLERNHNFKTKEEVYDCWHSTMRLMRRYVANLDDETCNERVSANDAYVWEILVHLMNAGNQRRTEIQLLLKEHNIQAEFESFIRFYRLK